MKRVRGNREHRQSVTESLRFPADEMWTQVNVSDTTSGPERQEARLAVSSFSLLLVLSIHAVVVQTHTQQPVPASQSVRPASKHAPGKEEQLDTQLYLAPGTRVRGRAQQQQKPASGSTA